MGFTKIAACAALASGVSLPAFGSIAISTDPTQFMICKKGVCTPTADDAVLNVSDLEAMLATSNVTVATNKAARGQKKKIENITLTAPLSWGSGKALSLDASNSVAIAQSVSVSNNGGLSLMTNDGGTNGTLTIVTPARITFSSTNSRLAINGANYRLAATLPDLVNALATSSTVALTASYDASADGVYKHSPIASLPGTFEGLGNTISNLSINDATKNDGVGLFATIDGMVRDIHLVNVHVSGTGKGQVIGALVGRVNFSRGGVINASSSGSVTGSQSYRTGGLVGDSDAQISSSSSSADVSDEASSPTGSHVWLGGLVGYNNGGNIMLSFSTGSVTGGDNAVAGGLVGASIGGIDQSYATGPVKVGNGTGQCCNAAAGGLAGAASSYVESDTYSTGSVIAGENAAAGGIIGSSLFMRVFRGYSTGAVSGGSSSEIGGFFGVDNSTDDSKSACYWDMTTSGITDPSQGAGNIANDANVIGLTNNQLQKRLPKGFKESIWGQSADINNGLPYLLALPPQ